MAVDYRGCLKWIRYSGASVIVTLNPVHWRWLPQARHEKTVEWPSPNENTRQFEKIWW